MEETGLVPVMAVAIVNGIFSPWVLDGVRALSGLVSEPGLRPMRQIVYMASALILSTLTIMLAGVPAALYERLSAARKPVVVSSIWLAVTVLLTLPAIPNVLRALGGG